MTTSSAVVAISSAPLRGALVFDGQHPASRPRGIYNAYVVFARDTDFTNVVDPGVPGEGYDIVIHVVPMQ
jgi:hypothetical protein